jgi:hypothetical protein
MSVLLTSHLLLASLLPIASLLLQGVMLMLASLDSLVASCFPAVFSMPAADAGVSYYWHPRGCQLLAFVLLLVFLLAAGILLLIALLQKSFNC